MVTAAADAARQSTRVRQRSAIAYRMWDGLMVLPPRLRSPLVAGLRGADLAHLLAAAHRQAGSPYARQSLAIKAELSNRAGMATAIRQIGAMYTQTGKAADAVAYNLRSLAIRTDIRFARAALAPETTPDPRRPGIPAAPHRTPRRKLHRHVTGWLDQTSD